MANRARFRINASPSTDRGFDATHAQVLTFQLEVPAAAMRWTLEVASPADDKSPRASKNAPLLALVGATTGQKVDAVTPSANITTVAPSADAHTYVVRSTVNGGLDPRGRFEPDLVFERILVIRHVLGRRKIVASEGTQYSEGGWADAQNDEVDTPGLGTGDVIGVGGSTDGEVSVLNGVTGKQIRASGLFPDHIFGAKFSAARHGMGPSKTAAQNSAALQAAINAAHAAGGGVVLIPYGLCLLGNTGSSVCVSLAGKSNIVIRGVGGVGASVLKLGNGEDAHMFNVDAGAKNVAILDVELDGNRANQAAQVHCIRCVDVEGLWVQGCDIHDALHYGLGLQGATKRFVFLDNLRIHHTGGDGVDTKNTNDDNAFLVASNITIEEFGLNLADLEDQTGFDCRGAWQLTNIVVHWSTNLTGVGIRVREGELLDTNGYGGHETHITNFECIGPDIATNPSSTSIGVYSAARDVKISGGAVRNVHRGVMWGSGSARCGAADVSVFDTLEWAFYSHDSSNDNYFTDCYSNAGAAGGFRLGGTRTKNTNPRVKNTATAVNGGIEVRGLCCSLVNPTVVGSGTGTDFGLVVSGSDCRILGGEASLCARGIQTAGARTKIVGFDAYDNSDDGIRFSAGADDSEAIGCTAQGNADEGIDVLANRVRIIGGNIQDNGGAGVQIAAACADNVIDCVSFSGNAAPLADNGLRTRIGPSNIGLGGLLNHTVSEDVASAGTTANIDTPLLSSRVYLYRVTVRGEDASGDRATIVALVETMRSGAGAPSAPTVVNQFSAGTGLTLNASIISNSLRISVTNGMGEDAHVTTRLEEVSRDLTVEDS